MNGGGRFSILPGAKQAGEPPPRPSRASLRGLDATLVRDYIAGFRDPKAYAISHIGWGLNQLAQWSCHAVGTPGIGMDGRAFYGNVLFSTGPNTELGGTNDTRCHLDLPMKGCTLELDDELILKDGEVIPHDMRAPGR